MTNTTIIRKQVGNSTTPVTVGPSTSHLGSSGQEKRPSSKGSNDSLKIRTSDKPDNRRASLAKITPNDTPKYPPPAYRRNESDACDNENDYKTKLGINKYVVTAKAREAFIVRNKITKTIIKSEDADLVADILPIFAADLSGSMNKRVKRGHYNLAQRIANKFKHSRTRQAEQTKRVLKRMDIVEGLCKNTPDLYTTRTVDKKFERLTPENGNEVNSKSAAVMAALTSNPNGGTQLTGLFRQIKADHSKDVGDLSPVIIYFSTDGDSTDTPDARPGVWTTTTTARQSFENELKQLTNSGIQISRADGSIAGIRPVGVQMQYIGDDDTPFTTTTRYDNSTDIRSRDTLNAMMREVRERGRTGAYYRALDNEIFSGIPHFDVSDDVPSEQKDIKRATGVKPSKNEVITKEIIAPVSERLDQLDEKRPVPGQRFTF